MVIIFYSEDNNIYICSENEKMKIVNKDDPNLLNHIPNEDILYVQNAHYVTKKQFAQWIHGSFDLTDDSNETSIEKPPKNRKFIHPTANGHIRLDDIKTPNFPNGVALTGKWHFIPVDYIGEKELYESNHFKIAKNKGKIEIVDEQYVEMNKHKSTRKPSAAQAGLDSILVPADIKAETAAESGFSNKEHQDIIEIEIEA